MSMRDDLGDRMKAYEAVPKNTLIHRMPVVIRLDGKAFHTFTRGFKKPFDHVLMQTMQETMKYLCENIQNCVLGYCQSDEISLLLIDYETLDSMPWFGNKVEKMASVSASMATFIFNRAFEANYRRWWIHTVAETNGDVSDDIQQIFDAYTKAYNSGAMFDSRVFNIPKEDVTNYFYWRQLDATRNSINMVGQAFFSHGQLQNKGCNEVQGMLFQEKGINWNNYPTAEKRGCCCIKTQIEERNRWVLDLEIPVFSGDGRDYIEKFL